MCFHDFKLAVEIDGNSHSNKNVDYKIKRQKAIEQHLGCEFIRNNLDKEDFNILKLSRKYLDI